MKFPEVEAMANQHVLGLSIILAGTMLFGEHGNRYLGDNIKTKIFHEWTARVVDFLCKDAKINRTL